MYFFDRPDAAEVLDERVEVLLDLLAGHVEVLGEILDDLPGRALAIDAAPEGGACLVEDVQAVDLIKLAPDGDQNEFARDFAGNKVLIFRVDFIRPGHGRHHWSEAHEAPVPSFAWTAVYRARLLKSTTIATRID